jgi:hypothetical protein
VEKATYILAVIKRDTERMANTMIGFCHQIDDMYDNSTKLTWPTQASWKSYLKFVASFLPTTLWDQLDHPLNANIQRAVKSTIHPTSQMSSTLFFVEEQNDLSLVFNASVDLAIEFIQQASTEDK